MVTWPHFGHLIKGSCLGVSYTKPAACLVWFPYIFCWWRHVFYLSRDKKLKNIIFPFITIFYNFALKIETSWAKKVVKPILETWNAVNDVTVYVWFIRSLIKIFGKTIWPRKCQVTSSRCEEVILLKFHLQIWEEWPIWSRRCYQNQTVPGSVPTRRSAGLRDPTSLRRSRWPSCRKCKNAVMNIRKVRLSPP